MVRVATDIGQFRGASADSPASDPSTLIHRQRLPLHNFLSSSTTARNPRRQPSPPFSHLSNTRSPGPAAAAAARGLPPFLTRLSPKLQASGLSAHSTMFRIEGRWVELGLLGMIILSCLLTPAQAPYHWHRAIPYPTTGDDGFGGELPSTSDNAGVDYTESPPSEALPQPSELSIRAALSLPTARETGTGPIYIRLHFLSVPG